MLKIAKIFEDFLFSLLQSFFLFNFETLAGGKFLLHESGDGGGKKCIRRIYWHCHTEPAEGAAVECVWGEKFIELLMM